MVGLCKSYVLVDLSLAVYFLFDFISLSHGCGAILDYSFLQLQFIEVFGC